MGVESTAITRAPRRSNSKLNQPSQAPMSSARLPRRSLGTGNWARRRREASDALKAGNHPPIGQFHAVIPAQAGEFFELFFVGIRHRKPL
jgi:hypothetical protein